MARLLARSARREASASIRGRLFDLGPYPGVVVHGEAKVIGEVFRLRRPLNTLAALDRYEGPVFRREIHIARLEDGRLLRAWVYLYCGDTAGMRRIRSGDYFSGRSA